MPPKQSFVAGNREREKCPDPAVYLVRESEAPTRSAGYVDSSLDQGFVGSPIRIADDPVLEMQRVDRGGI